MTNSQIYTALEDAQGLLAKALLQAASDPARKKAFRAYQHIGLEASAIAAGLLAEDVPEQAVA